MAFVPVPNTVEVVFDYIMSGQATANVLHFTRLAGYTQADLDTLALSMNFQNSVYLLPLFTLTQQYAGVRVKGLASSTDISSSNGDNAGTGTVEQTQAPNNVSLCLTFRTGLTGRSARGRFYCQPPHAGDFATPNVLTTTYKNAMFDFLSHVRSAAAENSWTHVVVSRQHNGVKLTTGVVYPVTSIQARNLRVDSQRGRMPIPD